MGNTPTAVCGDCGKEIKGRSDKRFCDDTCRNNFNRKKWQAEQIPISEDALEIIRIIKKNYQLLKTRNLEPDQLS
jgi:predicted nucleic acid-binding Zn ribbon protein